KIITIMSICHPLGGCSPQGRRPSGLGSSVGRRVRKLPLTQSPASGNAVQRTGGGCEGAILCNQRGSPSPGSARPSTVDHVKCGIWHRRLAYRSRLTRLTYRRGFGNFHEFSRFHLVDIAVDRNIIGNQWVVSDTLDVLDDALRIVSEC